MSDDLQDSAHKYLARVTAHNKQEADARAQAKASAERRQAMLDKWNENKGSLSGHARFLADVNPGSKPHVGVPWQGIDHVAPFEPNGDVLTRLLDLENNCCGILYALNNATVTATCSGTTTVITMTFPSLPAVC
jgi:hypothetical protein